MATIDVTFTHDIDLWVRLQLAYYNLFTSEFPVGTNVIVERGTLAPLLPSDGTGVNYLALSDEDLATLITTGRPPDDTKIKAITRREVWKRAIAIAKRNRDRYLSQTMSDPMDEEMEE